MFNIPEPEIHDRVIIISVLFPREAEASSTAENLLHFQIASPASPLETNCPFPVSDMPLDPQARGCPKRKQGASPWLTCSQTSLIHLSPPAGRERGCASSPHTQARAETSKLRECTGLVLLQPGSATGTVPGVCASTHQCLSQPLLKRTAPGALLNQTGRGSRPLQPVSKSLHLESAAGRAPREAVCFASTIPGQPWQLGEDGHTVLHCYTSVLGQPYKSFWLMYASIGGNKQCLETKQGLNCWDKHAPTHKNALLWTDNRFLSG